MPGLTNIRDWVRYRLLNIRMGAYQVLEDDYSGAYRRLMKYRVNAHGHEEAVGKHDHDFGTRQFQFLLDIIGLQAGERVLDVGCGSLRLGKYLIPYLDTDCYVGMDISPDALAAGRQQINDEVWKARRPTLIENEDLRFEEVSGEFEVIWGHSLVTHLPRGELQTLLCHLPNVLAEDGQAFFTFFDHRQASTKDWGHSVADLHELAANLPIHLDVYPEDLYRNPKGQRLFSVRHHSAVDDRLRHAEYTQVTA